MSVTSKPDLVPHSPTVTARQAIELQWHEENAELRHDQKLNPYKKLVLDRLHRCQWEMLGDLTNKRVLEVGCGTGRETLELAKRGAKVVAIDLSPTLIDATRARLRNANVSARVDCRVQAAEAVADDGERFDLIYGNGILHHVTLPAFKAALLRILAPNGMVHFGEPLVHNPLLRLYRIVTPHLRSPTELPLSQRQIDEFVGGFADVRVEYFNLTGLLLFPVSYVVGPALTNQLLRATAAFDSALGSALPVLKRYSEYVVMQMRAPS
jgi:SAM-dependent methyltransferase